jgi:hypothetical protein
VLFRSGEKEGPARDFTKRMKSSKKADAGQSALHAS